MTDLLTIRDEIAAVLRGTVADAGREMDTGGGLGSVDLWVWIGGKEYVVTIRATARVEPEARRDD